MPSNLYKAFNALDNVKKTKDNYISGVMGFTVGGVQVSDVAGRPGYVWVRLHNNLSEVVQAYNDKVSPVYNLPVLVYREETDLTRYKIAGRDTGQYGNWQTNTNYVATHGNQHSFNPDGGGGGDVVWVFDRQIMPLSVYPSGTSGAMMVMIAPDLRWNFSNTGTAMQWQAVGGTGTASFLSYKSATGSMASVVIVALDSYGNPAIIGGGADFDPSITGGAALLPYLPDWTPYYTANYTSLAMVRLVSGTSAIVWDNIYDLRKLVCT
jgi:hypothetical protein